ncbi:flagellar protein FlgN [Paenarthrobacter sp. UW852]|uniref:flagellar protein FlgN n=1 Tax=Paenarthrobacter sp. UW852 TaxID=2951989 RepID=UPI0021492CC9|nr:flagellar protein FlgN [Paenarthrobacter sp. UW852]MCR1160954.1 flagellar protein FlgN [Paenarthrobacter sp. UW852]
MNWGTVGADELSATLWRERRQLDFLLFLLETQLLHLRAGNWHRLTFTAAELEKVLENLRFESLARGVEASALAAEWKAPDQSTLPSLISLAPPGLWPELLDDHCRGLTALLAGIDLAAARNIELLKAPPDEAGIPSLASGTNEAPGGDADLDLLARDANIQRALAAVRSATLPTLRDFLELD